MSSLRRVLPKNRDSSGHILIKTTAALKKRFKRACLDNDVSMNSVLVERVQEYVLEAEAPLEQGVEVLAQLIRPHPEEEVQHEARYV